MFETNKQKNYPQPAKKQYTDAQLADYVMEVVWNGPKLGKLGRPFSDFEAYRA